MIEWLDSQVPRGVWGEPIGASRIVTVSILWKHSEHSVSIISHLSDDCSPGGAISIPKVAIRDVYYSSLPKVKHLLAIDRQPAYH